jgi:hypothetical protein
MSLSLFKYIRENPIPGIDITRLTNRCGNPRIALESLRAYLSAVPPQLSFVTRFARFYSASGTYVLSAVTLDRYRIAIRSIKNACFSIAADDLGGLAACLEAAAVVGNAEMLRTGTLPFKTAAEESLNKVGIFLAGAGRLLEDPPVSPPKPGLKASPADS